MNDRMAAMLARLGGEAVLMDPRAAEARLKVARAIARGEPVEADAIVPYDWRASRRRGAAALAEFVPTTDWHGYIRREQVAITPVYGGLLRHGGFMASLFGDTCTAELAETFDAIANDASVTTAILEIDSPGGYVSEMADLAAAVRRLKQTTRVVAMVRSHAQSLATVFLAMADEALASPHSELGSIAVMYPDVDLSERDARDGLVSKTAATGKYKKAGMPGEAIPDELVEFRRASAFRKLDALLSLFGEGGRKVTREAIVGLEGRAIDETEALSIGLIDGVMTMDELIERELARPADAGIRPPASAGATSHQPAKPGVKPGAIAMEDPKKPDESTAENTETTEEMTAAKLEEEYPELVAQIREEAASAARAAMEDEEDTTPAAFADLKIAFAGNPDFVYRAQEQGWSMRKALREHAAATAAALKKSESEKADLKKRLDAIAGAGGEAVQTASSTTTGGTCPHKSLDAAAEALMKTDRKLGKAAAISKAMEQWPELRPYANA